MFSKTWQKLKKFWANNIEKNYKKISVAIGTFLITIAEFFLTTILCELFPDYSPIFYATYVLVTILTISFFGDKENGNGYHVPKQKKLEIVFQEHPEWRDLFEFEYRKFLKEQRELKDQFSADC